MEKVEIKCKGAGVLPFDKILKMQNDLKYLDPISYEKLKKNLLKNGISQPLQIWRDESEGKFYLLDGHQRLETLRCRMNIKR